MLVLRHQFLSMWSVANMVRNITAHVTGCSHYAGINSSILTFKFKSSCITKGVVDIVWRCSPKQQWLKVPFQYCHCVYHPWLFMAATVQNFYCIAVCDKFLVEWFRGCLEGKACVCRIYILWGNCHSTSTKICLFHHRSHAVSRFRGPTITHHSYERKKLDKLSASTPLFGKDMGLINNTHTAL